MDLVNKIKKTFLPGSADSDTRIMVRPSANLRHMNVKQKFDRNKPWSLVGSFPVKNVSSKSQLYLEDFNLTSDFKKMLAERNSLKANSSN